jgi:glycosyltransferase involved in cell wall biosynthesis
MNVADPPTPLTTDAIRRRILYVITKANWGGAQRYVYDLALASKEHGYDVAVAYGTPGELMERLDQAGIRTIPLQKLGRDIRISSELGAFTSLLKVLKTERPDVVHINSSKAGALGTLAARLGGVPTIIFTAHAWAFNESRPVWQKIVFKGIHAVTILLSHRTICVSNSVRHDMRWVPGSAKKLVVIRNGIREAEYLPKEEAREKLWPGHTNGTWIGMLSELHPSKRIEDAIQAIKDVRRSHPDAVLVVLGEGERRETLEKAIQESSLQSAVQLTGFVPNGPSYLHAFDIFLHTSQTDALAYAVIEAGLAGLPVVATRVGGIPEVVKGGSTGRLVSPRHPEDIANELRAFIEHPEEALKMGALLRTDMQKRFSIQRMIQETLALYVPPSSLTAYFH